MGTNHRLDFDDHLLWLHLVGYPPRPRLAARLLQELSSFSLMCARHRHRPRHRTTSAVLLFCLFIIYFCYLPLPGGWPVLLLLLHKPGAVPSLPSSSSSPTHTHPSLDWARGGMNCGYLSLTPRRRDHAVTFVWIYERDSKNPKRPPRCRRGSWALFWARCSSFHHLYIITLEPCLRISSSFPSTFQSI